MITPAALRTASAAGDTIRLPTSGTSGRPRWVLRTAASWVDSFPVVAGLCALDEESRAWVPGPVTASMNAYAICLVDHVGASLVESSGDATHVFCTPSSLLTLLDDDHGPLVIVVAGDRLSPTLAARAEAVGHTVHHYYGAAQLSFVGWGRDADSLRLFPEVWAEARDGELWVSSPWLCLREEGDPPVLRSEVRDGRLWMSVGDRGAVSSDGRLRVDGRPDAVTTGGATVVLADVEAVLRPYARGEVVVIGRHASTAGRGAGRGLHGCGRRRRASARRSPGAAVQPPAPALVGAGGSPGHRGGEGGSGQDRGPMTVTIVAARRTPIGTAGHGLADLTAADLAAAVLPPVLEDAGLTADEVTDVVLGNCTGPGGDLARFAALQAGFGVRVPGLTVDRQCGSGLAALVVGAALVEERRVVIAGGVESASTSVRPETRPVRSTRPGRSRDGRSRRPRRRPGRGDSGTPGRVRAPLAPARRGRCRARGVRRRARRRRRADPGRATAGRADPGATRPDATDLLHRRHRHRRHVLWDQRRGCRGGPDGRIGPGAARAARAPDPGVGHGRGVAADAGSGDRAGRTGRPRPVPASPWTTSP